MSRHHILPPIVYVPQPKPKKIETRKSRIQTRASGAVEDTADVEETYEAIGPGRSTLAGNIPPENFLPIEGSEHKPPSTLGRLSESTLKVMLLAQEMS
jgi:hypothetical protein